MKLGSNTAIVVAGDKDGDTFTFQKPKSETELLTPGSYRYQMLAEYDDEYTEITSGYLKIEPLLSLSGDVQTHNEKVLESITAVLEKRATREQESTKLFNGNEVSLLSIAELTRMKRYYEKLVMKERRGLSGKKRIPRLLERY